MRQLHDEPDELRDRMRARAQEVAEELQGTAKNLEDAASEEERNNADFCSRLDEITLGCETCGWWCETGEMCDNQNCDDCCKQACGKDAHEDDSDSIDECDSNDEEE
jgi:hypothetical protein